MHASANASALARTLLALAHARATGKLRISAADHARCELSVLHGHARAFALIGDAPSAVLPALAQAMRWTRVRTQLTAQPVNASTGAALAPWRMSELLLQAAELALAEESFTDASATRAHIEKSAFGSALERAGTRLIAPALAPQLEQGALCLREAQLAQLTDAERARLRAALWLGALVPRQGAPRAYTLLLRKHRQLRTQADPHALLELAPNAQPADARRALRRLASRLHPDALGPTAPPALRALSTELMCALVQAERAVSRDARA